MKRQICLLSLLLCMAMLFAACGGEAGSENTVPSGEAAYRVSVVDPNGAPSTGVIVKFLQNGQQVAMQTLNDQGIAEKTLKRGDYTLELMFTDSQATYHYDQSALQLTAEKTELTVTLSLGTSGEGRSLVVQEQEHTAYDVTVGDTYVKLTPGGRSYFLFTPQQAGMYQFSCREADTVIGYYGAPHYVHDVSAAEVVDNTFTVSVRADMIGTGNTGTAVLVIGLDSETATNAILSIARIGDPEHTVEDEPWMVYQPTASLEAYKLPAGAVLKDFDLTADSAYTLVHNAEDGFYHLNTADGPLVLVRLGEKSGGSKYLDSFETIISKSGVVKYFYDADGNFQKKESYTECLMQYIGYEDQSTMKKHAGCMDPDSGMYPLTEDLKYIIQQRGEYAGWFEETNAMYLFGALPNMNPENAWLFMCCYLEG